MSENIHFMGLKNYTSLLKDPNFGKVLWNTLGICAGKYRAIYCDRTSGSTGNEWGEKRNRNLSNGNICSLYHADGSGQCCMVLDL